MLAGMTSGVGGSMFPNLAPPTRPASPEMAPLYKDIDDAHDKLKNPRATVVTGHFIRIFDLHDNDERLAYEQLMLVLLDGVMATTHVMHSSLKQVLPRADGSSGWFAFLEWTEYAEVLASEVKSVKSTGKRKTSTAKGSV